MAISDYASIVTEINNHTLRSYSQAQIDTFLGLLQPKIDRLLTGWQPQKTSTVSVTSGVGVLPSDFTSMLEVS